MDGRPLGSAASSIAIWLLLWSTTQGLFMIDGVIGTLTGDVSNSIALLLAWILLVAVIFLFLYRGSIKKLFPVNVFIWSYLAVPLSILIRYFIIKPDSALSWPYFIPMILISALWQDLLTFGFLRLRLEGLKLKNTYILVAIIFWLGHVIFFMPTLVQNLPSWIALLAAACLMSWLTEKTKSFYVSNALHMVFLFLF